MNNRPITTLFLLSSLDGKITTGSNDDLDFDQDFPKIEGIKEGLHQYYEIEQTTDLWSLNSGKVLSKIGVNDKSNPIKTIVSFVAIDNHNLNENGIKYMCDKAKNFVIVTTNKDHPAFNINKDNLHIIYQKEFEPLEMLQTLYAKYNCDRITIQTGGTLNSIFLRNKVIDYVDIVIAPVLVGGKNTSTFFDGESLTSISELHKLNVLKLESIDRLED